MIAPREDAAFARRWVTVPVPEELLLEVNVLILNLSLAGSPYVWDLAAMREQLSSLDDRGRRMVTLVAESMLVGRPLSAWELSDRLGANIQEVLGTIYLANTMIAGIARPDLLWTLSPPGTTSAAESVLMMAEPLVEMVIAIDRGAHPT